MRARYRLFALRTLRVAFILARTRLITPFTDSHSAVSRHGRAKSESILRRHPARGPPRPRPPRPWHQRPPRTQLSQQDVALHLREPSPASFAPMSTLLNCYPQIDESHWLHRTRLTFSYNPQTLAPATAGSGWSKRLYIGLSHPEPYVWGSADNDRLGLPERRGPGGGRIVNHTRRVARPESLSGSFRSHRDGGARRWQDRLRADLQTGLQRKKGEERGSAGIVEMQAGGWSFAARDMEGVVWVWGELQSHRPRSKR
jgi:hypothetical protein